MRIAKPDIPLLEPWVSPRIPVRAPTAVDGMSSVKWMRRWTLRVFAILSASAQGGCAQQHTQTIPPPAPPPRVVVVAPVLNLSDRSDWDPAKVTDMVASAFQSMPGVAVVPVNRVMSLLAGRGQHSVETPDDALALAQEFGAQATVVAAVTEFDPYNPPRIGLVMQCYTLAPAGGMSALDPVSASRQASDVGSAGAAGSGNAPQLQVQRVFDASDEAVLREVKEYGKLKAGRASPSDWHVHVRSQQLFLRYACWSAVRSIMEAWERRPVSPAPDPNEAAA